MSRHPRGVPFSYSGLTDYRMGIKGDSYYWHIVNENFARNAVGITIHHSVTGNVGPDRIAEIHIARGWRGIGYHFVITRDGKTWYVGDLGTQRAHVLNQNHRYIGVCLIGEHHKYAPTKAQYQSAHKLCVELQKSFGSKTIVGHNALQATACPGSFTDMNLIRNGYPVAPPVDTRPEWLRNRKTIPEVKMYAIGDINLVNLESAKVVSSFKNGQVFDITGETTVNGVRYLITKYSMSVNAPNGLLEAKLSIAMPEPPKPPEKPPEEPVEETEPLPEEDTGIETPTDMKDSGLRAMLYDFFYAISTLIRDLLTKLKGE